jgi:Holliday junction resolvase RusA-like endonuclease
MGAEEQGQGKGCEGSPQEGTGQGESMKKVVYHVFVKGMPKAQPRPRMTPTGHVYNPPTATDWKNTVKQSFLQYRLKPLDVPVHLSVSFFLPRPQRLKNDIRGAIPHVSKPDVDNLLKAVMDAMTEGKVWTDDALVFATDASKWYAQDKTGAQIIVETVF